MLSLPSLHISRLRPGGACLSDEEPHQILLAAGALWRLPGLSIQASQALGVLSCLLLRARLTGAGQHSRSQVLTPIASLLFSSVQGQALWLSPSTREHVSNSPEGPFLPGITSRGPDAVLGETVVSGPQAGVCMGESPVSDLSKPPRPHL